MTAMGFLTPTPTPYDPLEWERLPLEPRAKLACEAWALQGYGAPLAAFGFYAIKVVAYIGAWIGFCGFTPGLGGLRDLGAWWLAPVAFQKAILWSMLFEVLGLGCGSGPLTGRYFPPIGGALYFLRPGTTKLPLFPRLPVLGGYRRTFLDAALYLALIAVLLRALVAPGSASGLPSSLFLPIVILVPILGLCDRTLFLALRAEHYFTTSVVLAFSSQEAQWLAGAKAVQLALWFFAGVSKLNHHFPSVVAVMVSNSPFTRFEWLRRRMYRRFPDDLNPSRLAVVMSHCGTALELSLPVVMLLSPGGWSLQLGIVMALLLHGFITSNVPMGVPIEWNFMMVYGAFALFWAHPDVSALTPQPLPLALFLVAMLVIVPVVGNFWPHRISFLLAMRYYAGNWPYSIWLFRGDSSRKMARLTKSTAWTRDQLLRFFAPSTVVALISRVLAFRLMHLQGRALYQLVPKAVERLQDCEYMEGELVAGIVLGWNFGDGHLHNEALLRAVQAQCGFEPGELRCIFLEAQPLLGRTMAYRIVDAHSGLLTRGELDVEELRRGLPPRA